MTEMSRKTVQKSAETLHKILGRVEKKTVYDLCAFILLLFFMS